MSAHRNNIVITGFMGTGKTTIAKAVAEKLGRIFEDTDALIEKEFGKTIPDIFAEDGEAAFRAAEKKVCEELCKEKHLVISTGGGTLIAKDAHALFEGNACLFCLDTDPKVLVQRLLQSTDRPLLRLDQKLNEDEKEKALFNRIHELLQERQPFYSRIRHHIDTSKLSQDEVCDEIISRFQNESHFLEDTLFVKAPNNSPYPILIRSNCLKEVDTFLHWLGISNKQVAIVSGDSLFNLYGKTLLSDLKGAGFDAFHCSIDDGEQAKNLESIRNLYDQFTKHGLTRDGLIIALGGGVTGDMAGFAAATYMRGIDFIQIPTTLLSIVDASVGGKTGVDLPEGKNLVGAFKQPKAVLVDPDTLKSLPVGEFRSGMAEVIKHAIIADAELFEQIDQMAFDDLSLLIKKALQVKIDIVEKDPFESGLRSVLNLGHTFGHAIEKCKNYQIKHGDAVAAGMVAAAKLGTLLGKTDAGLVSQIEHALKALNLPTRISGLDADEILSAMQLDKKNTKSVKRFIIPIHLGRVEIVENPAPSKVRQAIDYILS